MSFTCHAAIVASGGITKARNHESTKVRKKKHKSKSTKAKELRFDAAPRGGGTGIANRRTCKQSGMVSLHVHRFVMPEQRPATQAAPRRIIFLFRGFVVSWLHLICGCI